MNSQYIAKMPAEELLGALDRAGARRAAGPARGAEGDRAAPHPRAHDRRDGQGALVVRGGPVLVRSGRAEEERQGGDAGADRAVDGEARGSARSGPPPRRRPRCGPPRRSRAYRPGN
jgi:hypothetical protein